MHRVSIILLLLFFSKSGFGQKNKPVSGYIVSAYGDTAKGYLIKDDLYIDDGGFIFYDSSGNIANVKSKNWKGLGVYTKEGNHHFVNIKDKELFGKDGMFLERVLQGKISVYKYFRDDIMNIIPHSRGTIVLPKKDYEYYLEKKEGKYIKFQFEIGAGRKNILKQLFKDCEKVSKKVKNAMSEEKTFNLILEYNNTCN